MPALLNSVYGRSVAYMQPQIDHVRAVIPTSEWFQSATAIAIFCCRERAVLIHPDKLQSRHAAQGFNALNEAVASVVEHIQHPGAATTRSILVVSGKWWAGM